MEPSNRLQNYLLTNRNIPNPTQGEHVTETNALGDIKTYILINGKKEGKATWESEDQLLTCYYSQDKRVGSASLYNKKTKVTYHGKVDDKGTLVLSGKGSSNDQPTLKRAPSADRKEPLIEKRLKGNSTILTIGPSGIFNNSSQRRHLMSQGRL